MPAKLTFSVHSLSTKGVSETHIKVGELGRSLPLHISKDSVSQACSGPSSTTVQSGRILRLLVCQACVCQEG